MKAIVIAAAVGLVVGLALGVLYGEFTYQRLRKQVKELRGIIAQQKEPRDLLRSVTRFLFVTTQVFAIIWVSWSYVIATYSTVVLFQPFPAEELSKEAVRTILGVGVLKVIENIFEHNEGAVFGRSKQEENPPPDNGSEEGMG